MSVIAIRLTLLIMTVLPATAAEPVSLQSMSVFYIGGTQVESPYSDGRDAKFPTADERRSMVRQKSPF